VSFARGASVAAGIGDDFIRLLPKPKRTLIEIRNFAYLSGLPWLDDLDDEVRRIVGPPTIRRQR
jgi:hypothetical protein